MYEIYKSTEGRKKTFLVFSGLEKPDEAIDAAKKYFKTAEDHLGISPCWILNDELYFEDPNKKTAKKKIAIYWRI